MPLEVSSVRCRSVTATHKARGGKRQGDTIERDIKLHFTEQMLVQERQFRKEQLTMTQELLQAEREKGQLKTDRINSDNMLHAHYSDKIMQLALRTGAIDYDALHHFGSNPQLMRP